MSETEGVRVEARQTNQGGGDAPEHGPEQPMSSVLLKVNAKGEVQPEVKVYVDARIVESSGMEVATVKAAELAQQILENLASQYGWPGVGPRGLRERAAAGR